MSELVAAALLFGTIAFILRSAVRVVRAGKDLAHEVGLLKKT
jgi:hypothetical protein